MKLQYHMALASNSASVRHTSGITNNPLNFYMDSIGHSYAYANYYTEREGA
ncbi:MAG: hypothetical protein IJ468_13720 [Lachnospiraceae bacterium]|nr:hypothetical protein [Lachnospiraceae bacterium]